MTNPKQFSNEFDVLYSTESNPWIGAYSGNFLCKSEFGQEGFYGGLEEATWKWRYGVVDFLIRYQAVFPRVR